VNKAQFIEALANRLGSDKKRAGAALDAVLDEIYTVVVRGEKLALTGFGSFEKRVRDARTARNPATGASVKVKKTSVPAFRAGAEFKAVTSGAKKLAKAPVKAVSKATATKATASKATASKATAAKATGAETAGTTAASRATGSRATKAAGVSKASASKASASKASASKTTKTAPAKAAKAPATKAAASNAAPAKTAPAKTARAKTAPAKTAAAKATAAKSSASKVTADSPAKAARKRTPAKQPS
jgi:DNA-binding protein HU-beta